jgi:hypothetical protein
LEYMPLGENIVAVGIKGCASHIPGFMQHRTQELFDPHHHLPVYSLLPTGLGIPER